MSITLQAPLSAGEWVSALAKIGFYATPSAAEEICDWAISDVRTLVIKGAPYGGKTALAESVVRVLDGGSLRDLHCRMMYVAYYQDLKFGELFFESRGVIRALAAQAALEAGESPEEAERRAASPDLLDGGLLLTALQDTSYNFVLIDNYTGALNDPKADETLAEFIAEGRVRLPDPGGDVARLPGQELKVVVTLSSNVDERTMARGEFYEALRRHAVWVDLGEADRTHRRYVLSNVAPKLYPEVIREFVVFIDDFNGLPGNDHRVTLGEQIVVAKALEEVGARALSARLITDLSCMIAKSRRSTELLDEHAAQILEGMRRGTIN